MGYEIIYDLNTSKWIVLFDNVEQGSSYSKGEAERIVNRLQKQDALWKSKDGCGAIARHSFVRTLNTNKCRECGYTRRHQIHNVNLLAKWTEVIVKERNR